MLILWIGMEILEAQASKSGFWAKNSVVVTVRNRQQQQTASPIVGMFRKKVSKKLLT